MKLTSLSSVLIPLVTLALNASAQMDMDEHAGHGHTNGHPPVDGPTSHVHSVMPSWTEFDLAPNNSLMWSSGISHRELPLSYDFALGDLTYFNLDNPEFGSLQTPVSLDLDIMAKYLPEGAPLPQVGFSVTQEPLSSTDDYSLLTFELTNPEDTFIQNGIEHRIRLTGFREEPTVHAPFSHHIEVYEGSAQRVFLYGQIERVGESVPEPSSALLLLLSAGLFLNRRKR